MKIFEIKTSSYNDENFYLMTDLSSIIIEFAIRDMVQGERAEGPKKFYYNEDYVDKLRELFPKAVIIHYETIPLIEI
jgi:hypothetical protein